MKVLGVYGDTTGCGQYRIFLPVAEAGRQFGVTYEFRAQVARLMRGPSLLGAEMLDADVVIFQRPLAMWIVDLIPLIQAQGVAVVVEIDDDFATVDPFHHAYRQFQPSTSPDSNFHHLARACRLADLVTVTTPALAKRYGTHGRVVVLPNCVPAALLDFEVERDGRTCGWAGFTQSHPGDLRVAAGGVQSALEEFGWRFRVVGDGVGVQDDLRLRDEPEVTGGQDIEGYAAEVARLDVGIAPLRDTRFNAAKSHLKGLEYAALGVPFVASPRPEYERLAVSGVGVLARRPREWRRELRRLFAEPALRAEMAAAGREVVWEAHTIEGQAWRWREAWEQAVANRARAGGRDPSMVVYHAKAATS